MIRENKLMSNIKQNVYTENIYLRNKFDLIYRIIKDSGFIHLDNTPTPLGLMHPMIMEIFRIAKKEKEIERIIKERS